MWVAHMMLTETPGTLKKFGRTSWRFQRTFKTPLENLRSFVTAITGAIRRLDAATVTIDTVVFEPKHLLALVTPIGAADWLAHDVTVSAVGREAVEGLLEAALSDWADFLFVPQPKPFVIYADHDEYTTFYAQSCSNLNSVVNELSGKGFAEILGYKRSQRSRR